MYVYDKDGQFNTERVYVLNVKTCIQVEYITVGSKGPYLHVIKRTFFPQSGCLIFMFVSAGCQNFQQYVHKMQRSGVYTLYVVGIFNLPPM